MRGSLDQLIGLEEEGRGNRDPEGLRGLEIDDQLELRRLLHRQVGGLTPLQEAMHISRRRAGSCHDYSPHRT